ncbi:hypothetical protein K435DRAFT_756396 [Dendrothele bispora CBS 962.96]|uniref:Uncharacterized protein n=1 Tax=Dendrothele bispora (strain CBS 962.96) TaxID=1314807 RepID=A0A4S8LYE1_DENBC|nr:hypothetical protein K435DRAFT_756396 [Dendrothele bispora CBS 962.96]
MKPQDECPIAEIVQYSCDLNTRRGRPLIHCFPISRLFRMCPGLPAVEITKVVKVNDDGEVSLPKDISSTLPRGKLWRDITKNSSPSGENKSP